MEKWLTKEIELLERIGQGGSGEVYKARLHNKPGYKNGKLVAVKLPGKNFSTDGERNRILSEAKTLEHLNHKNIVRMLFAETSSAGEPFIAMELVEGETLSDKIKTSPSKRLSIEDSVSIARQLASAINHICSKSIEREGTIEYLIHGDLKPRNLMISKDGALNLIDFGAARMIDPDFTNTLTNVEYTPAYADPKVENGNVSRNTEMFSLGAIFFEMLTGAKVISGKSLFEQAESRREFYFQKSQRNRKQILMENRVGQENLEIALGLLDKKTRNRKNAFKKLLREYELTFPSPQLEKNSILDLFYRIIGKAALGFGLAASFALAVFPNPKIETLNGTGATVNPPSKNPFHFVKDGAPKSPEMHTRGPIVKAKHPLIGFKAPHIKKRKTAYIKPIPADGSSVEINKPSNKHGSFVFVKRQSGIQHKKSWIDPVDRNDEQPPTNIEQLVDSIGPVSYPTSENSEPIGRRLNSDETPQALPFSGKSEILYVRSGDPLPPPREYGDEIPNSTFPKSSN